MVEAPFSLYECIEDALGMVESMAAEKQLELAYRVDCGAVPPKLVGDAGRLKQVMVNLLCTRVACLSIYFTNCGAANAIKFTETGDVELAVVSCESMVNTDAVLLAFEVRDTGIGIAPEQVGKLFSLFSQLDSSSTRKYEGSGLGMCACLILFPIYAQARPISHKSTGETNEWIDNGDEQQKAREHVSGARNAALLQRLARAAARRGSHNGTCRQACAGAGSE